MPEDLFVPAFFYVSEFCDNQVVTSLSQQIKQKAFEIGFDKIGIVPAEFSETEFDRLQNWLGKGFQAEMRWMEREPEKRINPKIYFPEAESVIAVALNYYTAHTHENDSSKGKISRYAWGDDYHDIMREKLRELFDWIKTEIPHATAKICADIQPVSDKMWAVKSGIGWMGKHSNVITGEFGSWVFLGEILIDVKLDYDRYVEPDRCGSCTACLDACPTNAIVAPYMVDSNLCLSYATIESRAPEFPEHITENLNGWLYGCDICQDVCPWNRFQKPSEEPGFEPRTDNISPDLSEILSLTQEQYTEKFRGSAMKRAKLGGLKRNAAALVKADKKI